MGYVLEHHVPVEDDIRRVMSEQLKMALEALDGLDADVEEAIHSCRKRCKKIRAAARLVRPAMTGDHYARINTLARDAARELARHRDAMAMAEMFDRLTELTSLPDVATDLRAVAAALTARARALEAEVAAGHPAVARARELVSQLGDAIDGVELEDSGYDSIGPGVVKTYRRGRDALVAAIDAPTGANFHDWRKRAKYTRYHLDLLVPSAPTIVEPTERSFHHLTDALGDAHDLVVLDDWLRNGSDEVERLGDTTDLRVVINGTRAELEHRAIALGHRLYAESPKRFGQRLETYWRVWDAEDSRSPAGELERVFG